MEITSLNNKNVIKWAKLKKTKYQNQYQQFIIEEKLLIEEAEKAKVNFKLIKRKGVEDGHADFIVSDEVMKKISTNKSLNDVVALCDFYQKEVESVNKIVYLDNVQDPGNVGTIIRSAHAFGFEQVVLANNTVNKYNYKLVRATKGSMFHISIVDSIDLEKYKSNGYQVVVTALDKEAKELESIENKDKMIIVFGNEGQGVSSKIEKLASKKAYIKMNNFDSLNVASSAAIVLHHFKKRWGKFLKDKSNDRVMKTRYLMKRFLPYFKPYKKTLVFDLFCASLTTVAALSLPLIVRLITQTATEDLGNLTTSLILWSGFGYIILRIIETIANFFMQSIGHIMGAKIETDMRRDLFNHIQKMSLNFYNNTKVGQIMARITSDLSDVTEFAHHGPEELFVATINISVSFIVLSFINLKLTLIIFAFLPVMLYFSRKLHKKMRAGFKRQRVQIGHINADVEDSLLGIRVVKSFANEPLEIDKFAVGNNKFLNIKRNVYFTMAQFHSVIRIFDGLMYIVVVVLGAFYVKDSLISVADYMAYLLYVSSLLTAIRRIVQFLEQFQRGMTGIERFIEILDTPVDITDKENAIDLKDVQGTIEFKNVSFAYEEDNDVLKDFNLKIPAGKKVALVGPSGGGKTTISNLIQRFYEVDSGGIYIDNTNIEDIKLESLRNNIGVVQQDVYLFSGNVYDNIEYGRPGASKEDIIKAAKMAGAHEFIEKLSYGYNTYVGERGVKLSGGQKQRISIARVFLKNPQIVVLDEATSALDNENEKLVQASLEELAKNRTTITIAHRLTTIKTADNIVVLSEDGILEQGSHQQLMENKSDYFKLYKMYEGI